MLDNSEMPVMGEDAFHVVKTASGREGACGSEPALVPLRELVDDRLLHAPLERSRDAAGGLRCRRCCGMSCR